MTSLPNLPTDNLYKFVTLFSISIIIVLFISISNDREKLLSQTTIWYNQKIRLKELRELKGQTSKEFLRDSSIFVMEDVQFKQMLSDYKSNKDTYLYISILFSFVTSASFVTWYLRHQRYQDIIIKSQAEPHKNDKLSHLSKIQAELEIECYKIIWPQLVRLNNEGKKLQSFGKLEKDEDKLEKRIKLNDFQIVYTETIEAIENNRPFFSKEVYQLADELFLISSAQSLNFMLNPNESKYDDKYQTTIISVTEKLDKLTDAIRKRLGDISVLE